MKETKKYALRATELLTEAEQYEIKAGEKVPIIGDACTFCTISCTACAATCTACTSCKVCLTTMMDVIVIP